MGHPADAHDWLVPVGCILRANGTVGEPLSPPPRSAYELGPHASSGALVYYDRYLGRTLWEPPPGSTPLQARPLGEPSAVEAFAPPCFPAKLNLEAQSLCWTGCMPLYKDVNNKIFLYHTETGRVRGAPWISLREKGGCVYFANLVTRGARWLPPRT